MFILAMAEERSAASNYIIDLGSSMIEKVDGSPSVFNLNGKALFNFKIGRGDNRLLLESEVRDSQANYLQRSPLIPLYLMMSWTMKNMAIPK
jgi:hypothetical protein